MEPWEALDVDDSDLPSLLLRPCKRTRQRQTTSSPSQPIFTPSSSLRSQSQPSQTLDPYSQQFDSPTTSSRRIPGPARAIQAAMLRKTRDNRNFPCDEPPISTQEYIRRAAEDAEEDDDDFKCNAWLCAIEFLSQDDGMVDCVLPSTPLRAINKYKYLSTDKVDKVVAVIKSCTSNGLGDLIVTLKDPTGTIGAIIHRKVLTEGEFAKDILVGSVLILQKVSVFAPSRSAHYLNITLSNVVKVLCKDIGPPLRQNYLAFAVKYAAPGAENCERTKKLQMAFSMEQQRTDGMMNDIRQNAFARGRSHIDNQKGNENPLSPSDQCSNGSSINQNAAVGREFLLVRRRAAKEVQRMDFTNDDQRALEDNDKWPEGGNLSGSYQLGGVTASLVENHNDEEIQRIDGVPKQLQTLISRSSLPQWTDEQLNELFAGNFEDDGFLF